MTDRPILFNDAMIRAILAGRKTQTRRVVKPQPEQRTPSLIRFADEEGYRQIISTNPDVLCAAEKCPYGRPGDRLWVRETRAENYPAVYRADVAEDFYQSYLWTPSIHMPRHASRITLEITGVRVERVQDITEEDAEAEGATSVPEFMQLWDSCYPDAWKRWNANPFVWCIEFKRVQP